MIFTGEFTLLSKSYVANDIISLTEIKDRLGISPMAAIFDTRLALFRASAIFLAEKILNTYLLPATVEMSLKSFANLDFPDLPNQYKSNFFIIAKTYIQQINNIIYLDLNKNSMVLPNIDYFVEYKKNKTKISSIVNYFPDYYTVNGRGYLGAVKVNFNLGLFNNINYFKNINDTLFIENIEAMAIKDALFQYIQSQYEACEENIAITTLERALSPFTFFISSKDLEL